MKADIAFEDEAWIGCGNHSGRMWGLVGQPPEIRACDEKCGDHVLSMVTAERELMFDVKTEKLVSSVYIDFLKKMIGNRTRPLIVIADKASYYMSHEVKKFAEDHAQQIRLFFCRPIPLSSILMSKFGMRSNIAS